MNLRIFLMFLQTQMSQFCYYLYIFYCVKLWKNYDSKTFFKATFLIFVIVSIQNRSTLFPAALFFGITILKCRFKYPLIKPLYIAIIGCIAVWLAFPIITSLIEETQTQVTSTYDPRVIAMDYFLNTSGRSLSSIIFGTGNISFLTSSYVATLQESHIHYSDVGFVGFWHQYGILATFTFIYYLLKCLVSSRQPWNSKYLALTILICGGTISYFGDSTHLLWFILFYYQYCLYKASNKTTSKKSKLNVPTI